jgi:hypothetical protein
MVIQANLIALWPRAAVLENIPARPASVEEHHVASLREATALPRVERVNSRMSSKRDGIAERMDGGRSNQ